MAEKILTPRVSIDFGYIGTLGLKLSESLDANENKIINMYHGAVGGAGNGNQIAISNITLDTFTYTAGNGLSLSGNTFSVVADTVGGANLSRSINLSSNGIAIKIDGTSVVEDGSLRLSVSVGNSNIADSAISFAKVNSSSFLGFGLQSQSSLMKIKTADFIKEYTFSSTGGNWSNDGTYDIYTIPNSTHGFGNNAYIIDIQKLVSSKYQSFMSSVFDCYLDTSNSNIILRVLSGFSFEGKIIVGYSDSTVAL